MKQRGFTVLELMTLIAILIVIGAVFWTQKTAVETSSRDDSRKTAINALYYGLEEVYYPTNQHYPKTLSSSTLSSVDPKTFKDPNGVELGKADSTLIYEGKNCTGDACASYTLRALLENEADYVKDSRR